MALMLLAALRRRTGRAIRVPYSYLGYLVQIAEAGVRLDVSVAIHDSAGQAYYHVRLP